MITPDNRLRLLSLWVLGTVILTYSIVGYGLCKTNRFLDAQNAQSNTCETKLKRYIRDDYIAEVIARSGYPYLLAAIAKVESDYKPQIKGDGGDSHGLYQIQEKHWGTFDKSVEGQTLKAEQILSELIKQHGYSMAVERWNGTGKQARAYKKKVFACMKDIRES